MRAENPLWVDFPEDVKKQALEELNALPVVKPHYHRTKDGLFVKCYHGGRNLITDYKFWVGMTMGFPAEHLLWEKVWPFKLLTVWMGL
jgi:hypothetical protein